MSSSDGARRTGWQPRTASIQALCLREGDVERAGMGLGLGEGRVVAAGAADDRAPGAAAARRQQVAVRCRRRGRSGPGGRRSARPTPAPP